MARGLVLPPQTRATITRLPFSLHKWRFPVSTSPPLHSPISISPIRLFCTQSSLLQDPIQLANYKEAFSRRMVMAGLKPRHRIAIGVSGGPDSMALCCLTAAWKTEGSNAVGKSGGFVDDLLAVVVDHGLRSESKEEADIVSGRVSKMGIRCEIASCSWPHGKPKQGHLQEEARDIRYQKLQSVCIQHQIGVLLIAHHADDQAELFILRLSRNSGVLGLAGMAFVSQMFFLSSHMHDEDSKNQGILVVRPLLDFSKDDLYKICIAGGHDWVEDPTNQSPLYARNRIRMSLRESSYIFKSEMQVLISACRKTRAFVDQICSKLIKEAVTLNLHGYAIVDLEILNPSRVKDICLAKFVALILQFISQRHRPIRGSTSKLLLDYFLHFPCKTSLTAAGCYLSPAPGSKGTKVVICCSVDCPLPSRMGPTCIVPIREQEPHISSEVQKIIADAKSLSDHFSPDASSEVNFLESTSESVLTEAKRLDIISESTYRSILSLQGDEIKHFREKIKDDTDCGSKIDVKSAIASSSEPLQPGKTGLFMNRIFIKWEYREDKCSLFCKVDGNMGAKVRPMIESDWLHLAKLSKSSSLDDLDKQRICKACESEQITDDKNRCSDYLRFSAARSLKELKSIPVAARRSLPVLVDQRGQLLSIPSIGFKICSCLEVSRAFKPRVPLGGGYSSFL